MSAVKKIFEGKIKRVIAEYIESTSITHPGTIGALREQYLFKLLEEVLPTEIKIDTGFICSPDQEKLSPQIDILATQKNRGFSFPLNQSVSVHPYENTLGIFEIKSKLETKHFQQLEKLQQFISHVTKKHLHRTFIAEDIINISNFVNPVLSKKTHAANNIFMRPPIFILTFDNSIGDQSLLKWFNQLESLFGVWILDKKGGTTAVKLHNKKLNEIETIEDLENIEGSIKIIEIMYEIFYSILLQNQYYMTNYKLYFQ